jgi:hypothetical protein
MSNANEPIVIHDSYTDRIRQNIARFREYRHGREFNQSARDLWQNLTVPQRWSGASGDIIMTNTDEDQFQYKYQRSRQHRQKLEEVQHEEDLKIPAYRRAWRVFQAMAEDFEWGPTYRRAGALGWGGNGLVVRYNAHNADNYIIKSIAVKRVLSDEAKWALEAEEEMMLNFVGANHLVNIIPKPKPDVDELQKLAKVAVEALRNMKGNKRARDDEDDDDDNNAAGPSKKAKLEIDAPGMIVMEFLPNGDLSEFIARVGERKENIPNRIMWKFFLCCESPACIGNIIRTNSAPRSGTSLHRHAQSCLR